MSMLMMNLGLAPIPKRNKSKTRKVSRVMQTMTDEERLLLRTEEEIHDEIAAFMRDGVPRSPLEVSVEVKINLTAATNAINKMSETHPKFHSRMIGSRRVCWMS